MKSGRVKMVLLTWLHGGHQTAVQNRNTGRLRAFASSKARSTSATDCGRTHWIPVAAGFGAAAAVGLPGASGAFEHAVSSASSATSNRDRLMFVTSWQGRGLSPSGSAAPQRAATRAASAM
jgi:hypothetical protein